MPRSAVAQLGDKLRKTGGEKCNLLNKQLSHIPHRHRRRTEINLGKSATGASSSAIIYAASRLIFHIISADRMTEFSDCSIESSERTQNSRRSDRTDSCCSLPRKAWNIDKGAKDGGGSWLGELANLEMLGLAYVGLMAAAAAVPCSTVVFSSGYRRPNRGNPNLAETAPALAVLSSPVGWAVPGPGRLCGALAPPPARAGCPVRNYRAMLNQTKHKRNGT